MLDDSELLNNPELAEWLEDYLFDDLNPALKELLDCGYRDENPIIRFIKAQQDLVLSLLDPYWKAKELIGISLD